MIPWLTILFIVLAGAFKAGADTLTHHFDSSIFRHKERKFWDPTISWKYAKYLPPTKYKVDAWHLFNSAMIVCFCAAVAVNPRAHFWLWELLATGLLFNFSFNLFYNKLFR